MTLAGFVTGAGCRTPLSPTLAGIRAELRKAIAYSLGLCRRHGCAIDLRSAGDQLLDSQVVRLEWIEKKEQRPTPQTNASKPPTVIQLDPDAIATLERFLKDGDILSARLLLKRAASAGNAQAALKLGMTFDPVFLSERGVVGFGPDVEQARVWYERAEELGSTEASGRLERLAHIGR